jgi:hypothetical protein
MKFRLISFPWQVAFRSSNRAAYPSDDPPFDGSGSYQCLQWIGAADLKPSTQARFDKVSKTLQPAPKADATPQPDGGASPAAATPATSAGASSAPSLNN